MKQKYIVNLLLACFLLFSTVLAAQNTNLPGQNQEKPIAELSIYPNPVTGSKIYISTQKNQTKEIEVYNVLGKLILSAKLIGKELDVTDLTPGIYILRIQEGNTQATRKLVVK